MDKLSMFRNCGVCGEQRIVGQPCKKCAKRTQLRYDGSPKGRQRQKDYYQRVKADPVRYEAMKAKQREIQTNRRAKLKPRTMKARLSRAELINNYRAFARRFLDCWTKRKNEGYFIYDDALPELQELRHLAHELLSHKITARGYLTIQGLDEDNYTPTEQGGMSDARRTTEAARCFQEDLDEPTIDLFGEAG